MARAVARGGVRVELWFSPSMSGLFHQCRPHEIRHGIRGLTRSSTDAHSRMMVATSSTSRSRYSSYDVRCGALTTAFRKGRTACSAGHPGPTRHFDGRPGCGPLRAGHGLGGLRSSRFGSRCSRRSPWRSIGRTGRGSAASRASDEWGGHGVPQQSMEDVHPRGRLDAQGAENAPAVPSSFSLLQGTGSASSPRTTPGSPPSAGVPAGPSPPARVPAGSPPPARLRSCGAAGPIPPPG